MIPFGIPHIELASHQTFGSNMLVAMNSSFRHHRNRPCQTDWKKDQVVCPFQSRIGRAWCIHLTLGGFLWHILRSSIILGSTSQCLRHDERRDRFRSTRWFGPMILNLITSDSCTYDRLAFTPMNARVDKPGARDSMEFYEWLPVHVGLHLRSRDGLPR